MPNLIQKTVLVDGPRLAVIHYYFESDGSGEFTNELILDASNDIVPKGYPTQTTLNQVWWSNSYYDAKILASDTLPMSMWVLPVGSDSHVDFRSFGGIKIPLDLDGCGNLLYSTSGFAPAGSWGTLVIEIKKD